MRSRDLKSREVSSNEEKLVRMKKSEYKRGKVSYN